MKLLRIEIPVPDFDTRVYLIRRFQPSEFEKEIKKDNVLNRINYDIKKVSKAKGFNKVLKTLDLFNYIHTNLGFICSQLGGSHSLFICKLYKKSEEIYNELDLMLGDPTSNITEFKKVMIEQLQEKTRHISYYLYNNVSYIYNNFRTEEELENWY